MCYKKIALTALSIAVLDGIFLNFLGPLFGKMVKKIQNSEMKVNLVSTLLSDRNYLYLIHFYWVLLLMPFLI
jgi:hypothetical protein